MCTALTSRKTAVVGSAVFSKLKMRYSMCLLGVVSFETDEVLAA